MPVGEALGQGADLARTGNVAEALSALRMARAVLVPAKEQVGVPLGATPTSSIQAAYLEVVTAGFALTAVVYHAVRMRAAVRLRAAPVDARVAILEGVVQGEWLLH